MVESRKILFFTGVVLVMCGVFVACNIYTLIPIYPHVSESLDVKTQQVVFGSTLFTLFYSFGLLTFGAISDAFGRRIIIIFGLLTSAITTLLVGLSPTIESLYLFRAIQGFSLATFAPVTFTYCFEAFPARYRTLVISLINTGFLVAGILGQVISQVFADISHWRDTYYFFAISYAALFVMTFVSLPKIKEACNRGELLKTYRRIVQNKSLLKCYGIVFTLLFSFIAFYDGLNHFYSDNPNELFMLRVTGLFGAILSFFTGKILDKWGDMKTLYLGLFLGITSLTLLIFDPSFHILAIVSILLVSSVSILVPTMITIIGSIAGKDRAKALSIYSFILLTGATAASPIAIWLSFKITVLLLIFLFLANLLLGTSLFPKTKRQSARL
ncbi:predicted MFS family arabinose efflux permease [Bacillus oleivorans]|uniref:Predicted MFS family arabinose efflux permease n=1 Tax=Bacillus oleivorans TaxID=1448271 RepID=A0A285CR99_9BACI|nr:MFS transporter [Bacillus oleivorans]SNX70062.1 predicted MFS family arabinose efflux permease [Bacillus oleivorans]